MITLTDANPLVKREGALQMAPIYLFGADPKTPTAAPRHAELSGLPPVYIQVETLETRLDDSSRISTRTRAASGANGTLKGAA